VESTASLCWTRLWRIKLTVSCSLCKDPNSTVDTDHLCQSQAIS